MTMHGIIDRLPLAIVAALVIAIAAGCGATSRTATTSASSAKPKAPARLHEVRTSSLVKLAYEHKMTKLGASLGKFIASVGVYDQTIVSNATTEQTAAALIAKELTRLQGRLHKAAVALAAIQPPSDVRRAHDQLRQGVLRFSRDLDRIIALVRSGNFNALQRIATLKGVEQMGVASRTIAKKGYAILSP